MTSVLRKFTLKNGAPVQDQTTAGFADAYDIAYFGDNVWHATNGAPEALGTAGTVGRWIQTNGLPWTSIGNYITLSSKTTETAYGIAFDYSNEEVVLAVGSTATAFSMRGYDIKSGGLNWSGTVSGGVVGSPRGLCFDGNTFWTVFLPAKGSGTLYQIRVRGGVPTIEQTINTGLGSVGTYFGIAYLGSQKFAIAHNVTVAKAVNDFIAIFDVSKKAVDNDTDVGAAAGFFAIGPYTTGLEFDGHALYLNTRTA